MIAFLYLLAWRVIRFIPYSITLKIFSTLAKYVYRRNGRSVQQLRKNLVIVTGKSDADLNDLVQEGLISYSRYWAEAFKLPSFSEQKIDSLVQIKNPEILLNPLKQDQGVVVAVAHLANWDLAGRWFAMKAGEVVTVAERLKPERVFKAFLDYRRSIGLIAHPASDRNTVSALKSALQQGKLVALVADRDMSSSGVEVIFCGEVCTMPSGPAALAFATNSVLTTACLFNESDHLGGYVDPPIEIDFSLSREAAISKATQEIADRFTRYVQSHPEDWHVLQRLWRIHA